MRLPRFELLLRRPPPAAPLGRPARRFRRDCRHGGSRTPSMDALADRPPGSIQRKKSGP